MNCRACRGLASPPSNVARRGCNRRRRPGARPMTTRTSPRSRSGSRRHCAAPRRAATTLARPRGSRLDSRLRPPFRANEPRAPSGAPKALTEPAAPPRELDTQSRGDDTAPSEPAAPPRELDTQSRGDDTAPSEPAAPPREPDTQGRGDDGSVTNDRPWRLADLLFVPSGNGREKATINGVEVVKENGRYWIITPNGPLWSNIDERGVDPALNYLFEKRRQERQSGQ